MGYTPEQRVVNCLKCPLERVCRATDPGIMEVERQMRRGGAADIKAYYDLMAKVTERCPLVIWLANIGEGMP